LTKKQKNGIKNTISDLCQASLKFKLAWFLFNQYGIKTKAQQWEDICQNIVFT
jgi:hypothetical protein